MNVGDVPSAVDTTVQPKGVAHPPDARLSALLLGQSARSIGLTRI
jgi:hypothetical protein